jgi:arginase
MRRIAIVDAPSNLGLRPPTVTSVPGCAKAPGALRDHGLVDRLHARDAGCLTPPRYDPGDWRPGDGVCHAAEIAAYSRRLAGRIGAIIDAGEFPVVLGGDCSILLGAGVAMNRLGEAVGGRIGLVFVDGHSDFRHPGNASYVGAAAGEDLALVTGRGQHDLAAIESRRPYFRDVDVVVLGIRAQDEYRLDLQAAGIVTRPVPALRVEGAARTAQWARDQLVDCAGYWVHVDVDVLDPAVMPAVDAPDPGGIAFPELELLLAGLVDTPHCLGVEITVFDPDYDPDGAYAEEITRTIVAGLTPARTVMARPDLVAARRDLAGRPSDADRAAGIGGPGSGPGIGDIGSGDHASDVEADTPAEVGDIGDVGAVEAGAEAGSVGTADAAGGGAESADVVDADDPQEAAGGEVDFRGEKADDTSAISVKDGSTDQDISDLSEGDGGARDTDRRDADGSDLGHQDAGSDDASDEPAELTRTAAVARRPLGAAPLLDSDPLPATRPGMLRPRTGEGFSLPTQRPAFDIGPGEPADIT